VITAVFGAQLRGWLRVRLRRLILSGAECHNSEQGDSQETQFHAGLQNEGFLGFNDATNLGLENGD
jgi:hypothetical protein